VGLDITDAITVVDANRHTNAITVVDANRHTNTVTNTITDAITDTVANTIANAVTDTVTNTHTCRLWTDWRGTVQEFRRRKNAALLL
jgi:hypothetical protein